MEEKQKIQEFIQKNKKTKPSERKVRVTNSFGVYDVYKLIRKNHWYNIGRPVTEKEFYSIIRGINKLLAEEIITGKEVVFPERMGSLELVKHEVGVSIVEGHLKNTYPIDWAKTWELWYNDREAMQQKILVRNEQKWVYKVKYCKDKAVYENKTFYQFILNTLIKKALKDKIQKGVIDTVWLKR